MLHEDLAAFGHVGFIFGHGDEEFVVDAGFEHLGQLHGFGFGHDAFELFAGQGPQFEGVENNPVEQGKNHGTPHQPQPPVGQAVVELLDAVKGVIHDGVLLVLGPVVRFFVQILAHLTGPPSGVIQA